MSLNHFLTIKFKTMDLKLTVFSNNAASQTKQERAADNTIKTTVADLSRIAAKDEAGNVLQFTTDYQTGKGFELGRELTVTIS